MRAYFILLFLFVLNACGDKKSPSVERVEAPTPVEIKAEEKQDKIPEAAPEEKKVEKPVSYSLEHLLEAHQKSLDKVKSKIGDSTVKTVKVWKDAKDIFTIVTVTKADESEEAFFYRCHFHGKKISCHAKKS